MRSKSKAMLALSLGVLALSAGATASASAALPEFKSSASIRGTGGQVLFEEKNLGAWTCTSSSLSGSVTGGSKTAHLTVTFKGCTMTWLGSGRKCGSPAKGEAFTTAALTGTLGYVSKAAKTVGLSLQASTGEVFAEFECETTAGAKTKVVMNGALVGALTPVNKATTHYELSFTQSEYKQVTKLEGAVEDPFTTTFGSAGASPTGVTAAESIEAEKTTEIEA